jgi:two-component system cell cycle response regulator DivK
MNQTPSTGQASSTGKIRRILVVEDNDLNVKLFRDLLISQGYGVIHTRDGVEAFRLARTHRPDLVLMDVQLPEVSGLEVARWLKEDPGLSNIPVIAVTAFAMSGDEEKAKAAGCAAYVTKPIAVRPFLDTVAQCLGEAKPQEAETV